MLFNVTHIFNHNLSLFVFSLSFLSLFRPENFEDTRTLPSGKMIFSLGAEKNNVSRAFLLANGSILLPLVATHAQVLCTRTRYLGSFCFYWL